MANVGYLEKTENDYTRHLKWGMETNAKDQLYRTYTKEEVLKSIQEERTMVETIRIETGELDNL